MKSSKVLSAVRSSLSCSLFTVHYSPVKYLWKLSNSLLRILPDPTYYRFLSALSAPQPGHTPQTYNTFMIWVWGVCPGWGADMALIWRIEEVVLGVWVVLEENLYPHSNFWGSVDMPGMAGLVKGERAMWFSHIKLLFISCLICWWWMRLSR
jgi:hypothetical protein